MNMRSVLFVPANKVELISKAFASGADQVILDLEDGVAEADKKKARFALANYLEINPSAQIYIRSNALDSEHFRHDLGICIKYQEHGVKGVMIPKVEDLKQLRVVCETGVPVWPLIETSLGMHKLFEIASLPCIERISLGSLDLSAELGLDATTPGAEVILDHCRSRIILASHAAGLQRPIESVCTNIDDLSVVLDAAIRSRDMGFEGMLCIHPKQVPVIRQAYADSQDEIEWAQRVIARAETEGAVFALDGQMIDAPVITRALKILKLSKKRK